MLVSNKYRFIYLKTIKTAGTSIEIYFEPYCLGLESYAGARHQREAGITPDGIVGYRGPARKKETWYNHMPAELVRQRLGNEIWSQFLKFCAVRNPFDKVVSQFWFGLPFEKRGAMQSAPFEVVRAAFSAWVSPEVFPIDRDVFMIDGKVVVDAFIRYECLEEDMENICRILDIPWMPERLGRYKSNFRVRTEHFSDYYDERAESLVRLAYALELDNFQYQCAR